jgi:HSP20 family molecular chaperone IbpA
MAVAGFSPSELDNTVQENTLLVTGKAQREEKKRIGGRFRSTTLIYAVPGGCSCR